MRKKNYVLLSTMPENFSIDENLRIAHNRFDHDGYRWWNTWWPGIGTGGNEDIETELNEISDFMRDLFPKGLPDMQKFIWNSESEKISNDEYNLYIDGKYTNAWIRLILRKGDYNMYIKFFKKLECV